ncbi:TlpA disulfide reductase family protein [Flavobacterium pectinovorum]|uniref:TlpA disulfide reductase family protein n=1 Tax=Flavobacterium pectinovorum TaxID=29533 RepID=UPI001FACCDC3|nr:TlpA disulfide reductase family protein [Flavobacterium pectinovorum]MCI9846853.1 TlpA family protein disulfide reductase [Flavobacterium pectinovorum]
MKKTIMILLLVSQSFWAQTSSKKNYEVFSFITDVNNAEVYYNEFLQENSSDKLDKEQLSPFQAQLAADWLAAGSLEKYNYYKSLNPDFSAVHLLDLCNVLESWTDEDKNTALVEKISSDLLNEINKGTLSDGIGRTQILYEVNAVANARLGNIDLAMKNIEKSTSLDKDGLRDAKYFKDTKANYLNRYAVILSAAGQDQKAFDLLTKAVRDADSNPLLLETLKKLYAKVKGNSEGSSKYITDLQNEAYQNVYKKVEKEYIKTIKPMPKTIITDLNGKNTNLADYRGKILVIDFWATLCKPCVAAFSGFELVVDEYKNEPFQLFVIDLFETQETVKTFVTKKHITLDVLHDEASIAGDTYSIQTKGTPTKIVFDYDGNIRFDSSGYQGSTHREYYKLKSMVEIIKNKHQKK